MRLALALVLAVIAAPAFAQEPGHHPPGPRPSLFVLSGEGSAYAVPDIAIISSGVVTAAATAREALDANTERMTKLIASFKSAGIEPKDLGTSGFTVQPQYTRDEDNKGNLQAPRIAGYEVRNTVTVKVRDLKKLGAVLDMAVTEGSNQIDGPSFDISKKEELRNEARKKALADARAKAELYAAAAGVKLGRLRDLSETSGGYVPPAPMAMRMDAAKASAPVPVEAGEQEVSISITTTWEIAP